MKFKKYLTEIIICSKCLNEAKSNMIVCPHCGREFKSTDTEANDKLNQITLDNKGKAFFVMYWDTEDPFGNKHVLELYFRFNSATQIVKGMWKFVSKSRTPLAITNMQNKKPMPEIYMNTTPKLRQQLVDAFTRGNVKELNKLFKFPRLDNEIYAIMRTGTEELKSGRQLRIIKP